MLMTRQNKFYTQNGLSGLMSFPLRSMRIYNHWRQYFTALNVRNPLSSCALYSSICDITLSDHGVPLDNADKDATDYFRGVVKIGEKSQRVLQLTETIIRLNPAHYSAWCVSFGPLVRQSPCLRHSH